MPKFRFSNRNLLSGAVKSLSLMALGASLIVGCDYLSSDSSSSSSSAIAQDSSVSNAPISLQTPENYVTTVVESVGPAVVRIDASRTVQVQTPEVLNDPFLRRFFGNQIPTGPSEKVQQGVGSGFIVSSDGVILTNAHVIAGADQVTVTLKDGRTYNGEVVGADPVTDVATVRIDAEELPTVTLGDSDELRPGEWAIAIGNPLGLDSTVTTGIISATGRSSSQVGVPDKRVQFIQTDAAINPGNSGGPLLNAEGEVIGINTAIIRGAQGLGFAIPINRAEEISAQLIDKGSYDHAFLGIQMAQLNDEIQQQLKVNFGKELPDEGVVIVQVVPNSAAAKAGLRSGDVILQLDEQKVEEPSDVQKVVEQKAAGDPLAMTVERDGRSQEIAVTVGTLPNQS
ncbi:MAG: HhoA/HhoB/HtrA family serine endopeptidase [Cyanobacteria bacterium P01_H01_bin.15]